NAHLLLELPGERGRVSAPRKERPAKRGIAIVARAARFAAAPTFEALGQPSAPALPQRWWGVTPTRPGHYFDEVTLDASRFRIPPRELEEMLPQQALML